MMTAVQLGATRVSLIAPRTMAHVIATQPMMARMLFNKFVAACCQKAFTRSLDFVGPWQVLLTYSFDKAAWAATLHANTANSIVQAEHRKLADLENAQDPCEKKKQKKGPSWKELKALDKVKMLGQKFVICHGLWLHDGGCTAFSTELDKNYYKADCFEDPSSTEGPGGDMRHPWSTSHKVSQRVLDAGLDVSTSKNSNCSAIWILTDYLK